MKDMATDQNIENLSKNDIVSIIKACNSNNVKQFKAGGLELEFKHSDIVSAPNFETGFVEQSPEKKITREQ